jgi:hypothetical protein
MSDIEFQDRERARMAKLARHLLDLDRCPHGRHQGDRCFDCGEGISPGNPFLPVGTRIGTTLYGQPIWVPPRERRNDPEAWLERPTAPAERRPLAILNTSIVTADGQYTVRTITPDEAVTLAKEATAIDSAVGHEATAQVLSQLLGVEVPVNRQVFEQQVGQQAVIFKPNGRLPQGQELSIEDLGRIGFTLKLLTRIA